MTQRPSFWFPAKRHGYGWGPPVCWQGWMVLIVYFILQCGAVFYFEGQRHLAALWTFFAINTVVLVAIIALKGEKPLRWRWGSKK